MRTQRQVDPLMEWGHQVAVIVFVIALFGAIMLLLAAAVSGGHSRTLDATVILAGGGVLAYGIIWLRKRRERAMRPPWMGTTTEWEDAR
jgi:hypothetical protein